MSGAAGQQHTDQGWAHSMCHSLVAIAACVADLAPAQQQEEQGPRQHCQLVYVGTCWLTAQMHREREGPSCASHRGGAAACVAFLAPAQLQKYQVGAELSPVNLIPAS